MVLYYMDGKYGWPSAELARFKDAVKVSITVLGHPVADICDCENGDLTPQGAAAWVRSRAGHLATIYTSLAQVDAVREACKGLKYDLWVADWTGEPHEVPGAVAVQWADPAHGSGGDWDISSVWDDSWYPSAPTWQETALRAATALETSLAALVHQAADLTDYVKAHQ